MKIMVLSQINYEYFYQRPQQFIDRLAKKHEIIWIESPSSYPYKTANFLKQILYFVLNKPVKKIGKMKLYKPIGFPMFMKKSFLWFFTKPFAYITFKRVLKKEKPDVLLVYCPIYGSLLKNIKVPVVYDCVDDFSSFSSTGEHVAKQEQILLKKADLTIVPAYSLMDKIKKRTKRIDLVANGVPFSEFSEFKSEKGNDVIYVGAIADWIDYDLVFETAKLMPKTKFVFYGDGPVFNKVKSEAPKNVKFLGKIPYFQVKEKIASSGVCILPFKLNDLTNMACPIKIFEYFALGKPVVSTSIQEVKTIGKNYVKFADNPKQFKEKIEETLTEKNKEIAYKKFASKYDWDNLTKDFEKAIKSVL